MCARSPPAFGRAARADQKGEGGARPVVIFDSRFVLEISRLLASRAIAVWLRPGLTELPPLTARSLRAGSMPAKHSFVCSLGLLDDHKQFIALNLPQSHDNPGKHPGCIG